MQNHANHGNALCFKETNKKVSNCEQKVHKIDQCFCETIKKSGEKEKKRGKNPAPVKK